MSPTNPYRRLLGGLLGVISVVAILLAVVYGYSARTFFHAETFATRVADGLEQPELARIVAGAVTDQVIAARRDLLAYRPLILGSLERVVASPAFRVRPVSEETEPCQHRYRTMTPG